MFKVRIRGIYATALTNLAQKWGYKVVQATGPIRERFKIDFDGAPPDLTVKDLEHKEGVLVIGKPEAVQDLLTKISGIEGVFVRKSIVELRSTFRGVVREVRGNETVVEISPGVYGRLRGFYPVGSEITVYVRRPTFSKNEYAELSEGIAVVQPYVTLLPGGGIKVSEHIRDLEKRKELLTLGYSMNIPGYCIKWRSSAQYADLLQLSEALKKAYERVVELEKTAKKSEPLTKISEGESIAEVLFASQAKRELDKARREVVYTVDGHHTFKSSGTVSSVVTDFLEHIASFDENLKKYIEDNLEKLHISFLKGRKLSIKHIKLSGEIIKLAPGIVVDVLKHGVILKRVFTSKGIYNGLNIAKEPGDYDLMEVNTDKWYVVHNYFSKKGDFKGTYISISTPPEISFDEVKYIDLAVDVVRAKDSEPEIIDREELDAYLEENLITKELYEKAIKIAEELVNKLKSPKQV
ncbi:MAG: hypothetical protein DRJ52_03525 [Thermoprotei archaeon]|nr:MAG: hypothetical protein DRJ52_03525 [Thermoprotei archaeon]